MKNGDKMTRFWIILLAVATTMVMALPAAAKGKPDQRSPDPTPTVYEATIETLSEEGIATACGEPLQVTRTDTRGGDVTHFESEGARLEIQAFGLAFEGESLAGCSGADVWPEYFRITLDGDQVAMLWIFDVTIEETIVVHPKSGKERTEEIRTDFRMGGPYDERGDFAAWGHAVDENGVITIGGTGAFNFVQYDSGRDPLFLPLENGSPTFELQITLTPLP